MEPRLLALQRWAGERDMTLTRGVGDWQMRLQMRTNTWRHIPTIRRPALTQPASCRCSEGQRQTVRRLAAQRQFHDEGTCAITLTLLIHVRAFWRGERDDWQQRAVQDRQPILASVFDSGEQAARVSDKSSDLNPHTLRRERRQIVRS